MFLTAPELILVLLGESWQPVVNIFRLLVIYSMMRPLFEDTGAFLTAIGKPKLSSIDGKALMGQYLERRTR